VRVQVTLELKAADLAASHFAVSPLFETIEALRTLREPGRHALHLPWVRWAENELARSRLDLPRVWPLLIEPYRQPEFLMPAPHSRLPDLGEELEALVATRPSDVRTSLARTFPADPPEAARALAAHPRRELRRLAEEIELSFSRLLEPHWQRIRSLLDADIVHRARTLTDGGAAAMLEQLHTGIRWRGDSIVLADAAGVEGDPATVEVHPGGLVLEPSVFIWPDLYVKRRTATRTTIRYPARGVGALWDPGPHRGRGRWPTSSARGGPSCSSC
jgi:hypothetical protein